MPPPQDAAPPAGLPAKLVALSKKLAAQAEAAYRGLTRYWQMRLWIGAALVADVAIVVSVMVVLSRMAAVTFEVWYQVGFPSNLVGVRNVSGGAIDNVELVLDGKYKAQVESIRAGETQGLEVDRAFLDKNQSSPPASYAPHQIRIHSGDDTIDLPITKR